MAIRLRMSTAKRISTLSVFGQRCLHIAQCTPPLSIVWLLTHARTSRVLSDVPDSPRRRFLHRRVELLLGGRTKSDKSECCINTFVALVSKEAVHAYCTRVRYHTAVFFGERLRVAQKSTGKVARETDRE